MDVFRGLISFAVAAFQYRRLVQLPIVTAHKTVQVHITGIECSIEIPRYAVRIVSMALFYPVFTPCHGGLVTISPLYALVGM